MGGHKNILIVIVGPTAVGKTHLSIEIAQAIDGEIVGADSRQVYRYMDIGTAKPSKQECALVPHHLIDIIDPDDNLTLARYQRMTYDVIDDIHDRGKTPLLVGGTGQYITAVVEGWSIPEVPPNKELRDELELFAREKGTLALHKLLEEIDAQSAMTIHPNNIRRVIRALEVCMETGEKFSDLRLKKTPPYHILELGFDLERPTLYQRVDNRIDQMMASGFLDEVSHLLRMGYDRKLPSMSGLGYAELVTHLLDDVPLEEAINKTKLNTHDFIRRQYTWFRGHGDGILWHNIEHIDTIDLVNLINKWLKGN